jgi:HlyD family secretion protein
MKRIIAASGVIVLLSIGGCSNNHTGSIDASGTLEAVEVNVSSKVTGQLMKLYVQEGSVVHQNDTVAVIDDATLQLQLKQAQAGVELADAQYLLLKNGARKEDLRSSEESVRQAESVASASETDFERMKELFSANSVTKKQYDDAESRHTVTQAQLVSARQNLQKLQHFARPEDLNAAKARIDQAKSQVDLIKKQISDSHILAPVSGTVTYKPVEVGELIGTGSIVVRISQLDHLELMIYVNEQELGKIQLGENAEVVIDTYPDKNYHGKVIYISPVAEFTPRNVQTKDERTKLVYGVKLQVENQSGDLKSGMPADAFLK